MRRISMQMAVLVRTVQRTNIRVRVPGVSDRIGHTYNKGDSCAANGAHQAKH